MFQLFGFRKSDGFSPEANARLLATRFSAIFGRASGQIFEQIRVLARQGPYSSCDCGVGEAALAADLITSLKSIKNYGKKRMEALKLCLFPYIWPLAGPNIAKKGGPLRKLARVHRQTHFGTFNFWIRPGF